MAHLANGTNGPRSVQLLFGKRRVHHDGVAGVPKHRDDPGSDPSEWFAAAVHLVWRLAPHQFGHPYWLGPEHSHAEAVGRPTPMG